MDGGRDSFRLLGIAVALAACGHAGGKSPATDGRRVSEYCAMAGAALRSAVTTPEREPNGLDDQCVREYAAVDGKIYVDARFTKGGSFETTGQTSCTSGDFVIRFDSESNPPSAAPGVVFLRVDEATPTGRPFFVTIEQPGWAKRAPNVLAMSPCYPAFGLLTRAAGGTAWTAKVVPPPRSPDDL